MKRTFPLIANVLSQVLFGFSYYFMKMGMAVVNQNTVKFLSFRFGLGFVVMSLLLLLGLQKVDYRQKPVGMVLLCGCFNPVVSQILETTSTTYAPISQISLYNSILPLLMLVFSAIINGEYPTKKQGLFVAVCAAGVFVANLTDKAGIGLTALGFALIIATNVVVSVNRVLVRRTSERFTPFEIVYLTTFMGAVVFTALSLGGAAVLWDPGATQTVPAGTIGGPRVVMGAVASAGLHGDVAATAGDVAVLASSGAGAMTFFADYFAGLGTPGFIISVAYMGIGSCVLAFLLMTYASANLPVAVFASTSTLSTVVGILAGIFLAGETFGVYDVIGTGVILAGVVGISCCYDRNAADGNRYHR
ncbi:MAG: DMT family transporter [Lachnospiraceae bacterium]|jgi:drug/metabolite transporter (DMT)-like permease|nr:DMT family transporter [Lachnospiraceae bacterium]